MRGYVDTRWGQLHYSRVGSGTRTIVLFHETPLNYSAFQRLVPLLADDFQLIAFDTPGYGESDRPPALTTIEEYAKTFVEGIETLGLDELVLYGVHTGASFAFAITTMIPERVDGLVVSGLPYYEDEVREHKSVPPVPEFTDDGAHLLSVFHWEPDAYEAEMRSRLVSGVTKHPEHAYAAFHAVYSFLPVRHLDKIKCPVLALSNELDPVFPGDGRLLRDFPAAKQIVVPSERLPLYWTEPTTIAQNLRDFIATL
jgi:pimeloyl-ACP methyl ester carboxylesterase